jgi:dihydrofolate synthase/folylpolyglutamate synthase
MASDSLELWLRRLEELHPRSMDLGLDRVGAVAHRLELLPPACPVITVAGTNGKGTCIATMESLLGVLGKTAGAAVSPHLLRFNERIRVSGLEVDDSEIIGAFEAIDSARREISLTYFEFAMLAALLVFRQRNVDVALLEVGLGGRLDAANIVDPSVAVITSIALDHQEWLGDTRGAISVEKAGILRAGIPAVIADADPPPELESSVAVSQAVGVYLGRDFLVRVSGGHWQASLLGQDGRTRELPALPAGALLPNNVAAGLQALLLLGEEFDDNQLRAALAGLQPGGRRELRAYGGREYLLDVAHNPAAVGALCEFLRANPARGRTIGLFSAMADKDIHAMILACEGCFDGWLLADQPGLARAAPAADIAAILRSEGENVLGIHADIQHAVQFAETGLSTDDRLVIFGSFHTVAAAISQWSETMEKGRA